MIESTTGNRIRVTTQHMQNGATRKRPDINSTITTTTGKDVRLVITRRKENVLCYAIECIRCLKVHSVPSIAFLQY